MFGFLGFILIFILFIVLLGIALLGNIIRTLFGLGKRAPKHFYGDKNTSSANSQESASTQSTYTSTEKKKIFAKDEGEYVEFEEVK
ncbi:MAG: DUF4834 family protein [Bacteroides sp.]|nr:DUF4834 family protein [Bacteroides sp.]